MSRARSESGISPLTASAVTRATTSLHTSPPFIVARLVAQVCSSPCCQFSVAGKTHYLQYSRKIDSVWPSTHVVHIDLSYSGQTVSSICGCGSVSHSTTGVFVNKSAPLSTPGTFLKFSFLLGPTINWGPDASMYPVPVEPQWRGLRSHLPLPLH